MVVEKEVFFNIIICSFRYALGRKTYIIFEICDFIMKYCEMLDERTKNVILNDLNYLDEYYEEGTIEKSYCLRLKKYLEEKRE